MGTAAVRRLALADGRFPPAAVDAALDATRPGDEVPSAAWSTARRSTPPSPRAPATRSLAADLAAVQAVAGLVARDGRTAATVVVLELAGLRRLLHPETDGVPLREARGRYALAAQLVQDVSTDLCRSLGLGPEHILAATTMRAMVLAPDDAGAVQAATDAADERLRAFDDRVGLRFGSSPADLAVPADLAPAILRAEAACDAVTPGRVGWRQAGGREGPAVTAAVAACAAGRRPAIWPTGGRSRPLAGVVGLGRTSPAWSPRRAHPIWSATLAELAARGGHVLARVDLDGYQDDLLARSASIAQLLTEQHAVVSAFRFDVPAWCRTIAAGPVAVLLSHADDITLIGPAVAVDGAVARLRERLPARIGFTASAGTTALVPGATHAEHSLAALNALVAAKGGS